MEHLSNIKSTCINAGWSMPTFEAGAHFVENTKHSTHFYITKEKPEMSWSQMNQVPKASF